MPKAKDNPQEKANGGGGGGYDPVTHQGAHPMPPTKRQSQPQPAAFDQTVVGSATAPPGARLDVPTGRPPGYSAAPGRYITHVSGSWQAPPFPPFPSTQPPQGVAQLEPPLPVGTKATHFSGPIVSGGIPQVPLWQSQRDPLEPAPIAGTPILTSTLSLDYGMAGTFTVEVLFPPDAILTGMGAMTLVQWTSPPTGLQLGTTSGAGDLGTITMPAAPAVPQFNPPSAVLPMWDAAAPQQPWTAYLTATVPTGGTQGLGLVMIQFIRIPQRWS